ncbi:MAG: hybrid sensor histidine kinase/response regulator [Oceanospirillaceae bacterium]|nr:hybrid sensor histidine kinase/response regulator [Oceanospirillaceae bacterium]
MQDNISTFSILIVDDKPLNIDILRKYLDDDHYLISATTSGEKALRLLDKVKIDLILLDVMMPDMDGYQTCLAIKKNINTRHIPVIFVTAKIAPEDLRQCFAVGAVDLITKPAHQDIVRARVKNQIVQIKQIKLEKKLLESNKLAELGSMVAEITHEVASPLGNLRLSIDYLVEKNNSIIRAFEEQKLSKNMLSEYLIKTEKALQMSSSNINLASNVMLSFKQVAVDQCSNNLLRFNLLHYMNDILLTLRPKLKKHTHEVNLDIDERIELNSYPGVLSQVIINLVNNTLLHAFEDNQTGKIDISAQLNGHRIAIIYRDNGIGMDKNSKENAFKKYFTTKAGQGGSGLGLAICKELVVDILEGELSLESTLGAGVCFTIALDIDIADKEPRPVRQAGR